jgi:hypothetical protein
VEPEEIAVARLGKHVPMAMNAHTALLDAVFYMRSVSYQILNVAKQKDERAKPGNLLFLPPHNNVSHFSQDFSRASLLFYYTLYLSLWKEGDYFVPEVTVSMQKIITSEKR